MSLTVIVGGNRMTDCRTIIGWGDQPLLQVLTDPLRVQLRTPPNLPSGRSVAVADNTNASGNPEARRAVRVIAEPRVVGVFWDSSPLVIATLLDPQTVHVKLDLRHLGINVFDDAEGLHVGANVVARNELVNCETAIGLT